VEGHRRYADAPEPGWHSGSSSYENPATNAYDSGVHERPSGAFRLPEQRPADGYAAAPYSNPDVATSGSHARQSPETTGTRMPVRGPEYPTVRPAGGPTSLADSPTMYGSAVGPVAEPTTVVPPVQERYPAAAPVYRTRRPVSSVLIAGVTVLLMVPVVLLLIRVTFVDTLAVRGVVPAVLLALGLPLAGGGLYALAAGGPAGRDGWLRPPLAYLPIGLLLLLAAGLAVA